MGFGELGAEYVASGDSGLFKRKDAREEGREMGRFVADRIASGAWFMSSRCACINSRINCSIYASSLSALGNR